jgi:hypothetical protein
MPDDDRSDEAFAYVAALTNNELIDELARDDVREALWVEIGLRLGVSGLNGIRPEAVPTASTGDQAARLRRFMALWQGQPEAD